MIPHYIFFTSLVLNRVSNWLTLLFHTLKLSARITSNISIKKWIYILDLVTWYADFKDICLWTLRHDINSFLYLVYVISDKKLVLKNLMFYLGYKAKLILCLIWTWKNVYSPLWYGRSKYHIFRKNI